ncbi:hypothetical protein FACS1894170_10200 [Planctomycetales bacterium]|nr:hypothetical protein FACS1894170_10200 [Planctomycetales bacterium]
MTASYTKQVVRPNRQNVPIRERGFAALTKELGMVRMVYFIRQFPKGHGDWSQERQAVLADTTTQDIEQYLAELRKNK